MNCISLLCLRFEPFHVCWYQLVPNAKSSNTVPPRQRREPWRQQSLRPRRTLGWGPSAPGTAQYVHYHWGGVWAKQTGPVFSRFHVSTLRIWVNISRLSGDWVPTRVDTPGPKLCPNIASIKQRTPPPPPQPSIDPQRRRRRRRRSLLRIKEP